MISQNFVVNLFKRGSNKNVLLITFFKDTRFLKRHKIYANTNFSRVYFLYIIVSDRKFGIIRII